MENPAVRQPSNGSLLSEDGENIKDSALSLAWSFGFNKKIVGGVHNLSDSSRNSIFFVSAHTGVIFDYVTREQQLLQGHSNSITCCAVSRDKRWAVTGDSGPDSMIVVWNTVTGDPVRTIVEPHPNGVIALDISPDGGYITVLSAPKDYNSGTATKASGSTEQQHISVWEWGSTSANPICSSTIEHDDIQLCVKFNTTNIREVVSNGKSRVVFWDWSTNSLQSHSPPLSVKDFRQKVGNFTQSLFLPESTQAITATEDGDVILWDRTLAGARECLDAENEALLAAGRDKRAVKIVKLSGSEPINFLTIEGNLIVTGGQDGSIRFYDTYFRIIAWFEDIKAGPVNTISFANSVPTTCTTINGTFSAPDFVIGTSNAQIVSVESIAFQELSPENRRGTLLVQGFDGPLAAVAMHPKHDVAFVVTVTGTVQAWDCTTMRQITVKTMRKEDVPTSIAIDTEGRYVIVGCHNGTLRVLRWDTKMDLGELACFCIHPGVGITQLKVSPDGNFLALGDTEHCVSLYRYEPQLHPKKGTPIDVNHLPVDKGKAPGQPGPGLEPSDGESRAGWTYIGRHRSHTAAITGLSFAHFPISIAEVEQETKDDNEQNDATEYSSNVPPFHSTQNTHGKENALSLVSVSEDCTMVEYDVDNSSVTGGIIVRAGSPTKIETGVLPTACLFHPSLCSETERFYFTTNDEYKIKAWNTGTKRLRRTSLGPTFGGPINAMQIIPAKETDSNEEQETCATSTTPCYVAYSTSEKVVGLVQFPFDGNPFNSIGLVAHPGAISSMAVSHDGSFIATTGGDDLSLNLWKVRTEVLGKAVAGAGSGVSPFLGLLEGGEAGELYNQIKEYFYYTQLRSQGEDSTAPRMVDGKIPISSIAEIVRALGYYPSEQEIRNMESEVRYSQFTTTGQTIEHIGLEEFVKLYLNHRPVYGVSMELIEDALRIIANRQGKASDTEDPLLWSDLSKVLQEDGEQVDLSKYLPYLVNETELDPDEVADATMVSCKILGFEPEGRDQEQLLESKEQVEG